MSMPWSRCPPARRDPKPLEASEKQHLASPEDCGRTDPVAGQQEHPARIISGQQGGAWWIGVWEAGAALLALPMVLASAVECFTCMSTESKNKMTFIRCFKECSGM